MSPIAMIPMPQCPPVVTGTCRFVRDTRRDTLWHTSFKVTLRLGGTVALRDAAADRGCALAIGDTVHERIQVRPLRRIYPLQGKIGYWLGVPFWNQGYTTEAARIVVTHGFEALKLHRVQATCLPDARPLRVRYSA